MDTCKHRHGHRHTNCTHTEAQTHTHTHTNTNTHTHTRWQTTSNMSPQATVVDTTNETQTPANRICWLLCLQNTHMKTYKKPCFNIPHETSQQWSQKSYEQYACTLLLPNDGPNLLATTYWRAVCEQRLEIVNLGLRDGGSNSFFLSPQPKRP